MKRYYTKYSNGRKPPLHIKKGDDVLSSSPFKGGKNEKAIN